MKNRRTHNLLFVLLGACMLTVSLTTGCSWSAESGGLRVNSPSEEEKEGTTQQTP